MIVLLIILFLLYETIIKFKKKKTMRDFPGGPVAKTASSQFRGSRLDPWSENKIDHICHN